MRVSIDIDGPMADFSGAANQWLADALGVEPALVDKWDWFENYGPDGKEAWKSLWNWIRYSEFMFNLDETEGAVDGVRTLDSLPGLDVCFVTARNGRFYGQQTAEWMEWRGLETIPIIHARDKVSLGFDLYLDDKPSILAEVAATPNMEALAYKFSYNEDLIEKTGMASVSNWEEAVAYIAGRVSQD